MSVLDPAASHRDGCPLARPYLYDPEEWPLECICGDLAADDQPYDDAPEWTI